MLSLLWKGVQLESTMGSLKFAEMVAVLLGLSHSLVVLTAKGLSVFWGYPDALYNHCAIGFSGVLFALKVVLNWNSPTFTNVYGIMVPSRHAAWAELLLIQMFVPGSSFLGHLCGIMAGLVYVHHRRWLTASGLFGALFRSWSWFWRRITGRPSIFGRGRLGGDPRENNFPEDHRGGTSEQRIGGGSRASSAVWRCRACTYDNFASLEYCEMCDSPYSDGASSSGPTPSAPPMPSGSMSVEDLRRARLARFNR
ncbi:hypothetical protein KP509_36G037600 [Ceratopteris richardii]|nr:hypothetical protein KP509_36G037600 [Ceratopteris richardii]